MHSVPCTAKNCGALCQLGACPLLIFACFMQLRYACVDVFTNFWSVVYIFSSKKTTYHFGGAHDDRLLLAIHASCQGYVRTLPPISKRFCIVRVILHTSLRYADACLFFCACTNGNSNLRQQTVRPSSPSPCTFVIRMFHTSLRYVRSSM